MMKEDSTRISKHIHYAIGANIEKRCTGLFCQQVSREREARDRDARERDLRAGAVLVQTAM